ncbi:MAG: hypothetical protein EP305_05260 [Bacteroidetes bacterium]|nr:MAG: hypothetical protein EP305_05260 [Bacteroidota bacterium]
MKTLLITAFLLLNGFTFSQKADLNTVKTFWETNIYEIIILDQEGIEKHTHFPVEGSWGYILDLEDPESTTDEDFTHNLKEIFTEEVRVALRNKTYNDLVHHTDENGELNFIVQVMMTTQLEDSDEVMESMMILYFKKFEGDWKLFQIELAG